MFKLVVESILNFEKVINENLEEGWRLYGEPFIYKDCLAQALLKGKIRTISTRKIISTLPVGQPSKQSIPSFPLTGTVDLVTDEK